MSGNRDIAAEVQECIDEGETNPEIIAVILGVSSSDVEAVLNRKSELSPKQILIEEIEAMNALIRIAQLEYQNFSTNNNASAIRTLLNARRDLLRELAEYEDPTANVRTLDVQVLAPFTRSAVLSISRFIAQTLREADSLVAPERKGALRELFDRNFRVLGDEFKGHYTRAIGNVGTYFAVDVDLDDLESGEAANKIEETPEPVVEEPKPKRKRGRQISRAGKKPKKRSKGEPS